MVPGITQKECCRNSMEQNQQTMPILCQPPSLPTTPTFLSTSPPSPMAAVTHNHDSEDDVAMTRHQVTSASHSDRDGRCHVAVGDVATKRRTTTMLSFVVSIDLTTVSTPLLRPKQLANNAIPPHVCHVTTTNHNDHTTTTSPRHMTTPTSPQHTTIPTTP